MSAYDSVAIEMARGMLPKSVKLVSTPEEALLGARAAILATEWPELVHPPLGQDCEPDGAPALHF